MLPSMLLIASALAEELETALNLCNHRRKIRVAGVPIWLGTRAGKTLYLLKLGVGPVHSAAVLERVLAGVKATRILLIGYAGALDPGLKIGELVVVDRASLLAEESWGVPLEGIGFGGAWPLADADAVYALALAAALPVHRGAALTFPCLIGSPEHKRVLFQRFHAAIVDMETASLARVASTFAIPLGCVRAVSDEADDDFIAFLSYEPGAGPLQRAEKTLAAGDWLRRYSQWRERSLAARQNLSRFMTHYLDQMTSNE
jgi:adenosylhomocysteine nucleosidase